MAGSAEAEEYCALKILQQTRDLAQGKQNVYPCMAIEKVVTYLTRPAEVAGTRKRRSSVAEDLHR